MKRNTRIFKKKYRNNQMVFVKQKKKTMQYKNFLISLNSP